MNFFCLLWAHLARSYSPILIEFAGTLSVQILFFWVPATVYLFLDRLRPAYSARHKLQPSARQPTAAEIRHCVRLTFRNQLLSVVAQLVNAAMCIVRMSRSSRTSRSLLFSVRFDPSPPSLAEFTRDFALLWAIREVYFYYAHRLLHRPAFFRAVHATHHRFTAPVAFASQYAHPAEHLLTNVLPVALPPKLLGTHVLTMWALLAWVLLETCTAHSGYDFLGGMAKRHDVHHERSGVNYGSSVAWLDWLHGTREGRCQEEKQASLWERKKKE